MSNLPNFFLFLGTDTGEMETKTEVEPEELAEVQGPDVENAHEEGLELEGKEVRDKGEGDSCY